MIEYRHTPECSMGLVTSKDCRCKPERWLNLDTDFHHFVVTFDGTRARVFVDGKEQEMTPEWSIEAWVPHYE